MRKRRKWRRIKLKKRSRRNRYGRRGRDIAKCWVYYRSLCHSLYVHPTAYILISRWIDVFVVTEIYLFGPKPMRNGECGGWCSIQWNKHNNNDLMHARKQETPDFSDRTLMTRSNIYVLTITLHCLINMDALGVQFVNYITPMKYSVRINTSNCKFSIWKSTNFSPHTESMCQVWNLFHTYIDRLSIMV